MKLYNIESLWANIWTPGNVYLCNSIFVQRSLVKWSQKKKKKNHLKLIRPDEGLKTETFNLGK